MVMTVLVPLSLFLACLAVVCGRHVRSRNSVGPWAVLRRDDAAPARSRPDMLKAVGPGERVLAILRPDLELGLSLTALAAVAAGMILSLGSVVFGPDALVPLALSLVCLLSPPALSLFYALRRAWIVTDCRLIAGPALELPLSDLTDLRILPLAVEVRGTGGRCLRLSVLADATTAATAIRAAAIAHRFPPVAR
jgi:hypothetical protein